MWKIFLFLFYVLALFFSCTESDSFNQTIVVNNDRLSLREDSNANILIEKYKAEVIEKNRFRFTYEFQQLLGDTSKIISISDRVDDVVIKGNKFFAILNTNIGRNDLRVQFAPSPRLMEILANPDFRRKKICFILKPIFQNPSSLVGINNYVTGGASIEDLELGYEIMLNGTLLTLQAELLDFYLYKDN
jgi:hypothetical protein